MGGNFLVNLRCGGRLSLFRRVGPEELRSGPEDLALLAAADLALNLVCSFLLTGGAGAFSFASLTSFYFHLPLMLLLGLLIGRITGRSGLVTILPVALVALSLPLELCHAILEGMTRLPRMGWLADYLDAPHYYRFFWWWTVAAIAWLLRLGPVPPLRRAGVITLFVAVLVVPFWFFPRSDLWGRTAENEGGEMHLTEEVLSAQARLLDDQLEALLPGRRDKSSLYLVGFAGDAGQNVFTREVTAVGELFAERFGAARRTVILANNPQTATTLPFATAGNLQRALDGVGRVMNRDNDILFLFLTSHGLPEHLLAVDNPPLELDGLTPQAVRAMLDRSRIRWKVVVVSACYSGAFLDPLKEDHTLIMTASDATHASFGCSYGEDFTWFGRAYFDEALRRTSSFTEAFAQARGTIRQWEEREGEIPSNPQMWAGREIRRKLALH